MTIDPDVLTVTFKALPVFRTMRSNLAMVDAFLRRSRVEEHSYNGEDLGFLGVEPGEEQLDIHNRSVMLIVVALLHQCIENYLALRRIDSRLEDPVLEAFFKSLGSRRQFFGGMKAVRNGVFHVKSVRSWRNRNVRFFDEVCDKRGGILAVMSELRSLFYDFTEKVFLGELRIWPDSIYEDIAKRAKQHPELQQRLDSGEITISEYLDATLFTQNETSEGR